VLELSTTSAFKRTVSYQHHSELNNTLLDYQVLDIELVYTCVFVYILSSLCSDDCM